MSRDAWMRGTALARRFVLCFALAAGWAGAALAADPYQLSLSDKLTIRVVEWQDAENSFTNWSALAGDYIVGADGSINFPYVGSVAAAGETAADLAKSLREGLSQALGLTDPPDVSVEVAAFGPVYVTGAVRAPGAYPYAPGLNVVKAISLAGGTGTSVAPTDRDLITMQGTYDVLKAQRARLMIQLARLDATLAGQNEITVPPEYAEVAELQPLVAAEAAQLEVAAGQLAGRIGSFTNQEALLNQTLDSLKQKQSLAEAQLARTEEQLETVQGLVDNGLAVTTRVASLQSSVTDLETRLLDIETARLSAEQNLSNMAVQRERATSDQFLQASDERRQVSAQLAELELKLATQERLILEMSATTGTAPDAPSFDYVILRGGSQVSATATDAVLPGDVVSVGLTPTR